MVKSKLRNAQLVPDATSSTTKETVLKLNLIVKKYINITDRQEESDRSNQGVASPDYAEPLITNHASSNHHVLFCPQKEEQVKLSYLTIPRGLQYSVLR